MGEAAEGGCDLVVVVESSGKLDESSVQSAQGREGWRWTAKACRGEPIVMMLWA